MMLEPLLDMQFRAREAQYGNDYPGAQSSIVVCDGIDVGRLLVHEDGDLLHVVDIALLAEFRGKGLGTAVLTEVAGRGKVVRLQVRKENPAGRLYERLGFVCEFEDELNRHLRREV